MSRAAPEPRMPEALTLNKHLDLCTVSEMSEFLRFWGPHEKRKNGRAELVDKLYRLMSDENVVYAKVDLLSEKVRAVLLGLLRKNHYSADLQGLFRGVDGLEMEYYEAEAALTALAKRGFVRQSRAREWLHYGRSVYAIPVEMALVMRGLAGADTRPLENVFVHETFTPGGVEAAANEPTADLPSSVAAAIEDLPNQILKSVAAEVIERFGGVITRHEFADAFGARGVHWRSGRFLREFGKRGLGTVGHLDLRARAIGVEDDALFFFHEVVERYVAERRDEPLQHDMVLRAHGDLMSDVRTVLEEMDDVPIRVAKEGAIYKAARARIAERLQFPMQPLLDRHDVADRVVALVRGLDLAVRNDSGRLKVTEKGEAWMDLPLLEKLQGAYGKVLMDGVQTLRAHHLRQLQAVLVDLLKQGDGWWPGLSLAMIARNRYLIDLARDDSARDNRTPLTVQHHALTELGHAAHDLLVRDFFSLGLVEVAVRGGKPAGVRLSALGHRLLNSAGPRDGASNPIVVNPDFEMLVLPEGDVDDLLHQLDRYALRTRTGEVVHCKLDRRRIERAAVKGESPDAIVALLESNARSPLPQNVTYSIHSWAGDVRSATLTRGVLFRASDPSVVEAILSHPALKECVESVLDPSTLFFNDKAKERQIAQELRSLGVYLK